MKRRPKVTVGAAAAADARKLHALIAANKDEGHLLPRTLEEVTDHATRFVVARTSRTIVGCAELAPLSPGVAEIRSLAVSSAARGCGIGTRLVEEVRRCARREGFEKLCAFTHAPSFFVQMGFSIVPHLWLTEKVFTDCVTCPLFRRCGQIAVVAPLDAAIDADQHAPVMVRHP
jgi:amino-acid N-acetyltransferase